MAESPSHAHSWKTWFARHGPKLLLCARQWTRSLPDAEDAVQEAFVRFWRNQRHLDGNPVALLLTSLRRTAIDIARSNQSRAARELASDGGLDTTEPFFESLSESEDHRRIAIESALQKLPPEQREVLVLKIWGELTFDQISEKLSIPLNTVASRHRYALATLRKHLTTATCRD